MANELKTWNRLLSWRKQAVALMLLVPVLSFAQEAEEVEELEAFVMTGSRLSLANFEGGLPVNSYTATDIARTPQLSVNQYLRFVPTSYGSGNVDESFVNGGDGRASVGLRGLPTLTVINGRRTATGDLNVIPMAAVDRIEILKDGNGAVYGADAVGGVINIITKKNYEGVTFDASYKNTTDQDISQRSFAVTYGAANPRGSVLFTASYYKSNDLFGTDRPDIVNPFNREFAATSAVPNPGRFNLPAGVVSADAPAGTYRVNNNVASAASGADFRIGQYGNVPASESDRFTYALYTPVVRPSERYNIFGSSTYELIGKALEVYTDVLYTRSTSQAGLAPSPSNTPSLPVIPASNYWNQRIFGDRAVDITSWMYRFVDFGPRNNDVKFDDYALTIGFKGSLFEDRLGYDVSWFWNRNEQLDKERNGINQARLAEVINGDHSTFTGERSFNPFTNPFDSGVIANDPEMLDYLRLEPGTERNYETEIRNFSLSGKIAELPAGWITAAGGYEVRRESFERIPDFAKQQARGSGWNATTAQDWEFEVESLFAEVLFPVISDKAWVKDLQIAIAARKESFDHLPDSDTTIYRAFTRYQMNDELTFRASYSEGYTAPTPGDLDPTDYWAYPSIWMQWLGVAEQPWYGANYQGNADLEPTESKSYNLGVVYSPKAVKGLSVMLDYYRVEQDNRIISDAQVYVDLFYATGGVVANPDGSYSKNDGARYADQISIDSDGYVLEILGVETLNVASVKAESIDLEVKYDVTTDFGKFDTRLNLTHVLAFDIEKFPGLNYEYAGYFSPNDSVGPESVPQWRGFLQTTWSWKNFDVTPRINYTASYKEDPAGGQSFDTTISAWTTFDLVVAYTFPKYGSTLRVGFENLTDEMPPLARSSFADNYDRATHNILGRMISVSWNQKF